MAQAAVVLPERSEKIFNNNVAGRTNIYYDYIARIDPAGDFEKKKGLGVLLNSIRNLLVTPLRSYPFDPEYGSLLYQKVFNPADSTTENEIKFEVTTRVKQFDNRVVIKSVEVRFFKSQKGYRLNLVISKGQQSEGTSIDFTEEEASFALEEG